MDIEVKDSAAGGSEEQKFLTLITEIGVELLEHGAEVNRAEDTVRRMGLAYGAQRMAVFGITNLLIVTMGMDECREYTVTRRIHASSADFIRVEALNSLSRRFCADPFGVTELEQCFATIKEAPVNSARSYIGSALVGSMFAIFFGGNLLDGFFGALFGMLICLLQKTIGSISKTNVFFYFLCSLLSGAAICLTGRFIPIHPDKVMIGDIMLLIPGLSMTNSIRDIFVGDTLTGIMRLTESVLWAGGIAFGYMLSMYVIGG